MLSANSLRMKLLQIVAGTAALFLAAALLAPAASAVETGMPIDLQAKLFLTALTFDKNLQRRSGARLCIGILYFAEVPQSEREAIGFQRALKAFENRTVNGLPLETITLRYSSADELGRAIESQGIGVLYIAAGTIEKVRHVTAITQAKKTLSIAGLPEYVVRGSVSMVVGYKLNRPKIYVNHQSSRAEGAEFSAKFLRVADILVD